MLFVVCNYYKKARTRQREKEVRVGMANRSQKANTGSKEMHEHKEFCTSKECQETQQRLKETKTIMIKREAVRGSTNRVR